MTDFDEVWNECISAATNSTIITDGAAREIADAFHTGEESATYLFADTGEITDADGLVRDFTDEFSQLFLSDTGPFDKEELNNSFTLWSLMQYVSRKGERGPQKDWEKKPVKEDDV